MKYLILFCLVSCGQQLSHKKEKSCISPHLDISEIRADSFVLSLDSEYDYVIFEKKGTTFSPVNVIKESLTIDNLEPDSFYEYKAVPISIGCESDIVQVRTREPEVFNSCHQIKENYSDALSGYFTLSVNSTDYLVFCDMENNEGGWTQLFYHDVSGGVFDDLVATKLLNEQSPDSKLYSILELLPHFLRDSKYKLWINYEFGDSSGNIWTQESNPVTDPIYGYIGEREDFIVKNWGGLEFNGSTTLMDGSVNSNNWWYAIGATIEYGAGTIPGPGYKIQKVTLFIK